MNERIGYFKTMHFSFIFFLFLCLIIVLGVCCLSESKGERKDSKELKIDICKIIFWKNRFNGLTSFIVLEFWTLPRKVGI